MNAQLREMRKGIAKAIRLWATATGRAWSAPTEPEAIGYVNGRVYTGSGWATSVGIYGGKIVAVGSNAVVTRALPRGTRLVELAGHTVFPGFFDLHVHPMAAGKSLHACKFGKDVGVDAMVAAVAACAKQATPGTWIFGGDWDKGAPYVKQLNKALLDRVAPNNPVFMADTTGHHAWVNSKALIAGGIAKDSPDPTNGRIERDAGGEPTGVLYEQAAAHLHYGMGAITVAEATDLVGSALDILPSYGITSITDASAKSDDAEAYRALADAGRLKLHVRGCILWGSDNADFDRMYRDRHTFERPNFSLDCVKVFMDGVPNESRSAAMLEPYTVAPGSSTATRGDLLVDPAQLNEKVTEWDRDGIVVKFHAGGDLAARDALNSIQAARTANGRNEHWHEVVHNPFTTPEDLARSRRLGAALEFSPVYWYPTPLAKSIEAAVGPKRGARTWPVREAIASGALVFGASDWPAIESPSPWVAIETLVTRRVPGGGDGEKFAGGEAITLKQAIDMYTRWPAIVDARQGDDGTIHVGGPADLVILDRNPFAIPIAEVHTIKALRTVAGGRVIYDSGEFEN